MDQGEGGLRANWGRDWDLANRVSRQGFVRTSDQHQDQGGQYERQTQQMAFA